MSVCLSYSPAAAECGEFAADIGRQRQVPNSKCKQCHVEIRDTRIKGLVTEAKTVVTNNIITK